MDDYFLKLFLENIEIDSVHISNYSKDKARGD